MRRHGPVIAHCTDSEDFPRTALSARGDMILANVIIIIINVKINVALSENASRTRYTIKIKLKLKK